MKTLALSLLLPVAVGPLTFAAMQALKKANAWVDAQSPLVKRIAVAAIACVLTAVGNLVGVDIACDANTNCLALLDQDAVKALLGAVVAYALHGLKVAAKKDG